MDAAVRALERMADTDHKITRERKGLGESGGEARSSPLSFPPECRPESGHTVTGSSVTVVVTGSCHKPFR